MAHRHELFVIILRLSGLHQSILAVGILSERHLIAVNVPVPVRVALRRVSTVQIFLQVREDVIIRISLRSPNSRVILVFGLEIFHNPGFIKY